MTHEGECCPFCDSEYLTKELQHPVCCHRQLVEEFEDEPTDTDL
jgi:RNA polymerase subunit RPABC4/transcription elongation factor Spt4